MGSCSRGCRDDVRASPALSIVGARPSGAHAAVWHGPRAADDLEASEHEPFTGGQLRVANDDARRAQHVVGVFLEGVDPVIAAARLRHELEHARHLEQAGRNIDELARMAHTIQSRELPDAGPGSGVLYNLVPTEAYANAAGALFARSLFGRPSDELLQGEDSVVLRGNEAPPPIEELGLRLIAFAVIYGDRFEELLDENNRDLADVLNGVVPGAADVWPNLRGDMELNRLIAEFNEAPPTPEQIDAAETPRDAWQLAAERMMAAQERALRVLMDSLRPTSCLA